MVGWIDDNWIEPGWIERDTAISATPIVLPDANAAFGATSYGDPGATALIYHQNPGPYSDEAIVILRTWAGQRLFGTKMPPEVVVAEDIGRFATLLEVSPVAINTVPLGNDLIGSIGATERPRLQVVVDNRDKFGSGLVVVEPLLGMPAAKWLHYGGGDSHLIFQGQVERVVIRQKSISLEIQEP